MIITIVTKLIQGNITRMALLLMLRTRNNTIGNKLVIVPCITLYYGDTCIVYICVRIHLPCADRLLRFSIVSKKLDYPAVVCCRAILAFCRCCHPTGRWLATLKTMKNCLMEEPVTGAVFELVASCTARPAINSLHAGGHICGPCACIQDLPVTREATYVALAIAGQSLLALLSVS